MSLSALSNSGADQLMYYADMVNSQGTGILNPETFYSLQLLDTIRDAAESYQYYKYAKSMPTEGKADKLTVRRWAPLRAHTTPLVEGVPPISDKGSVEKYEISTNSYGRYMEFTDKVDFKVVDPVVSMYTSEYSIVAVETLDLLAQEALMTNASKFFAGGAANQKSVRIGFTPAIADLRLIGLSFKKNKVKPVDSTYHCLVSPEFVYDMLDDPYVQNYMRINNSTGSIYDDGALPNLFGFSFHEVNNCPTSSAWTETSNGTTVQKCLEYKYTSGTGYTYQEVTGTTIAGGYENDSRTGKAASYIPAHTGFTPSTGFTILKQNHIIILGADALVRTSISGEDNAKMYVKPLGSAGVLDPIEQRQSIGFKINSVGFGTTRAEAIVDYICVPSQLNI